MNTNYKTIILTIGLFLALTASVSAAPGELDATFGMGGRIYPVNIDPPWYSSGDDIVVQPDQKIVVSAWRYDSSSNIGGLLLNRYLPNGSLDPTFGVGGEVFNSNSGGGNLALQPDGKILVTAGSILRYKTDGNLDTTFDGDGTVQISAFTPVRLAVQNNGKIVVAGNRYTTHGDPSLFWLARLNTDGSLDTAFGSNGIVSTAFPYTSSYIGDIVIQADGKIVAVGSTYTVSSSSYNIALSRYNVDGSLDTSFGTSGRVVTPNVRTYGTLYGSDVTLQAENKIVVAGKYDDGGLVIRYMPDGSLDASFGNAGQVSIPNLCPRSVAVQSNGKIVVAGDTNNYSPSNSSHELGRILPNGILDPTFGTNGRVTTVFPNLPQGGYIEGRVYGMAIQRDGKIVTAGYWSGTDWDGNGYWGYGTIARYLGDAVETRRARFDFDGDGRSDVSVFRPSDRIWYLNQSANGFSATQFGLSSDRITPADYDGDGKTDISVYRDGIWYWLKSSDNSFNAVQFGLPDDIPVPADYTGDGRAELAIYRNGTWWTLNLTNNQTQVVNFGLAADKPVLADYDGDERTDQAVYRNGEWHLNRSTQGYTVINFGLATDKPTVGDYDGDGKADQAVYRNGEWHILGSTQGYTAFNWGISSDIPTPADYDGDGRTDAAIFRDGVWWMRQSTNGISIRQFGLAGDKPAPAAFLP